MFEVKRTDAFDKWLKGLKGSQDTDIKNAHATWRELNPPAKKPAKKE